MTQIPLPEKDIALIPTREEPYDPNNYPQPDAEFPPPFVDPNGPQPTIDIALLPGVAGQRGFTGPRGPQGIPGPGFAAGGATGDVLLKNSTTNYDTTWHSLTSLVSYSYEQTALSSTWVITNPLDFVPTVTTLDSSGAVVDGDVSYSNGQITINFSVPIAGTVFLS